MVPHVLLYASENKVLGKNKPNKQDIILLHEIARMFLDIIFHLLHPAISLYYLKLYCSFFCALDKSIHFRGIVTTLPVQFSI